MFSKLLGRIIRPGKTGAKPGFDRNKALEAAGDLIRTGDKHAAVAALHELLEVDPFCVQALNDMGACLADIGDEPAAREAFEKAFALDDNFLPAVVNHAKMLSDQRRSQEALPFLEHAKHSNPDFSHVDAVYAGVCLHLGYLSEARHFQMRAWLANFDNLRIANGHLFFSSFDADETAIAAEHRFWAETSPPHEALLAMERKAFGRGRQRIDDVEPAQVDPANRRIRIGYWSPDFRGHSVRYFFRPLLEAHDLDRFELFLYHDIPNEDEQTDAIRRTSANFYDVSALPDVDLYRLVLSHRLDIFVELAGHTSNNRVVMLHQRFAPVQITALGYPQTTGLTSIDAKLMDKHVVGPDNRRYYTEAPLVLPDSFWCFDPKEDPTLAESPPVVDLGHMTFGCVGNIAKITDRNLDCWKQILDGVPGSRLLLRSINFGDDAAIDSVRNRLAEAGFDLRRIDLRKPEGGAAFFESYNDIDVILDTFPYTGGTTTCFATYMGVPVVSLYGESLISRMGLSILTNLGVPGLAVNTEGAYVARAVELASDLPFLIDFKQSARDRFKRSCLGNGKLFATQFEQACVQLLQDSRNLTQPRVHSVPALPADEIIRRAFFVMRTGQDDAVRRILNHCLRQYPENGTAHVLAAQQLAAEQRVAEAAEYLRTKLDGLGTSDRIAASICLARFHLLMDQSEAGLAICRDLLNQGVSDAIDRLQLELFASSESTGVNLAQTNATAPTVIQRILIIVPCDGQEEFNEIRRQLRATCRVPATWSLSIECCDEARRIPAYKAALTRGDVDTVLFLQKNIELHNPEILVELAASLQEAHIVGFAGASRWTRLDWRLDAFECKVAGFMIDASERDGFVELQWVGPQRTRLVPGMAVLDGGLLAISRRSTTLSHLAGLFDETLVGSEVLLEEDWTHAAHKAGYRLAVHRNLGALVRLRVKLDARYRESARVHEAEKLGFAAFAVSRDDRIAVSAPVAEPREAVRWLERFIQPAG